MTPLHHEIKTLIVSTLALEGVTPESIGEDTPLFGEGLGLDSIDAESDDPRRHFASVSTLAAFVAAHRTL